MRRWALVEEGYEVSDDSLVRSIDRFDKRGMWRLGKVLKQNLTEKGYAQIRFMNKTRKVHRLVADAFVPNPLEKPQVNHWDGNKANNYYKNLKWATNGENQEHSYRVLKNAHPCAGNTGALSHNSMAIEATEVATGKITTFVSQTDAARALGCLQTGISMAITGKIKTAYGFQWRAL